MPKRISPSHAKERALRLVNVTRKSEEFNHDVTGRFGDHGSWSPLRK